MSNVVDIRRARGKRPGFKPGDTRMGFTLRADDPPKLVALARVCLGKVELTTSKTKTVLTPSDAETLANGLLTLAASARAERPERKP